MALSARRLAIAILLAALAIRVAWVFATPDYRLVHDAIDYQRHAVSIANGNGFATAYGRETAFRPPAYPIFLAFVYWIFGPSLEWARLANALVGTGIVALTGVIAWQLWGHRVALITMALGAVYIPLILVGQSVMSEPLFVLCLLGAIACAIRGWALAAGVLIGLAVLGRANALILLLPLAWAVCRQVSPRGGRVPGAGKGPRPALIMLVACGLTIVPWTIRNYVVLDHFVPVSTQLGSALAGTYNSEAMNNKENPAAWMSLKRVDDYRPIFNRVRETNEAVLEQEASAALRWTTSRTIRVRRSRSRSGPPGGCSTSPAGTGRSIRLRPSAPASAQGRRASSASGSLRCWRWAARSRSAPVKPRDGCGRCRC